MDKYKTHLPMVFYLLLQVLLLNLRYWGLAYGYIHRIGPNGARYLIPAPKAHCISLIATLSVFFQTWPPSKNRTP